MLVVTVTGRGHHPKYECDNSVLSVRWRGFESSISCLGLLQKDLDLPRICVVGKQSSGKSSVMEALTGLRWGDDDIHHYIHLTKYTLPATGIRNLELWKMYVRFVERVLEAQVPILVVWKNAGWLIGGILPCNEWLLMLFFLGTTFWRNEGFSNLHTRRYRSAQSWWHMYTLRFRDLDARCGRGVSVCGERAWCRLPEVWPPVMRQWNQWIWANSSNQTADHGVHVRYPPKQQP